MNYKSGRVLFVSHTRRQPAVHLQRLNQTLKQTLNKSHALLLAGVTLICVSPHVAGFTALNSFPRQSLQYYGIFISAVKNACSVTGARL
jgi:hypothetical protein